MYYSGKCYFENGVGDCKLTTLDYDIFRYIIYKDACYIGRNYTTDIASQFIDSFYKYKENKEQTEFLIKLMKGK